jgi:hypothetical protein
MKFRFLAAAAFAALLTTSLAWATTQYPTGTATDSGIGTVVIESVNGSGQAVPAAAATPLPVGVGGTPFHVANAGGNSACTLTINAGAAGTYINVTDFWVTGSGATAASNVTVTYSGLAGGTSYDSLAVPAGVTTQIPLLEHHLTYPWKAAAAATQVQISVPALGSGNTAVACHVNGFYL